MTGGEAGHDGACHCGAVRFRVRLQDGLASARRCTCSYCRMRGAIALTAEPGGFDLLQGAEALSLYQFNTRTARHYFCRHCGIYTHHQRRSSPGQVAVNLACLAGLSPFDLAEVVVMDGVAHPSDTGQAPSIAGVLRYVPVDKP
jgi:hypothetical protein